MWRQVGLQHEAFWCFLQRWGWQLACQITAIEIHSTTVSCVYWHPIISSNSTGWGSFNMFEAHMLIFLREKIVFSWICYCAWLSRAHNYMTLFYACSYCIIYAQFSTELPMCLHNSLAGIHGHDIHTNIKFKALKSEEENLHIYAKYADYSGLQLTPTHLGSCKYLKPNFCEKV